MPVWIVELHKVPVAQVNLVVFSGTADDPPGKFGVASLTAAMLDEGAGSRSSLEIADAVDFLGADLGAAAGIDQTTVMLHVPVARLDAALPIMADVALRPSFPPGELERMRRERLTNILQARDDPATINTLAYSRVLFGPAHRYGWPTIGTALTIKSLTADDLRAFYTAAFQPANAALLIVGDVTPDKAMPLLESSFGGWKATGAIPPHAALPKVEPPAERQVYLVDKPGAAQSEIRIGGIGVARSTPDYFPIQILNTILGGSFSSRLNTNLREQHGYTYGASSSFDMRAAPGPFVATAAGADRQDGRGAEGILQRADAHSRDRARRRARARQELRRAPLPRRIRNDARVFAEARRNARLPPAGRLLFQVHPEHRGREGGGRAARRRSTSRPIGSSSSSRAI